MTSAAYTPSVTGWHRIEIRFSDGAGGAGGYDSASDFLNTNNLGFSSDDGATWQLLLDPGDGSLLLPERPEPVRVCETFFDGTTLAAALGRNEPPPSETGHANVFAVFDTAYHGDTLSAWPTARRVGLGVWKGAASTFVAQVAGLSGMRYLRFVTVSPDGARQHWSETICLPETPRRDGARAVFHAAHVTTTNTASASFHVIFNADSMNTAFSDIRCMLGLGGLPAVSADTLYNLKSFALVIILGMILSTPAVMSALKAVRKNAAVKKILTFAEPAAVISGLVLCTAYLVDGSFNPFLYFRF